MQQNQNADAIAAKYGGTVSNADAVAAKYGGTAQSQTTADGRALIHMTDPQGQLELVDPSQAQQKLNAGYRIGPPEQQPEDTVNIFGQSRPNPSGIIPGSSADAPTRLQSPAAGPSFGQTSKSFGSDVLTSLRKIAFYKPSAGESAAHYEPLENTAGAMVQSGTQAVQQAKKGQYGRAAVSGLSALDPFAAGPVSQINTLEDQGQSKEAEQRAVLNAGMLSLPFLPKLAKPGAEALSAARDALPTIPTRAKAGALFNQVSQIAGDTAIDVSGAGDVALQARDFAASGGRMPKVLRDFISRATDPKQGPITYDEARGFYQNAGSLSANERNGLTPAMQRMVDQFRGKLGDAIGGAADQAGAGQMYRDAMGQYRTIKRIDDFRDMLRTAGTSALKKGAPAAVGAAGGGYLLYKILDSLRGQNQ